MPHPLMESANRRQNTLNLAGHLHSRYCNVGGKLPAKNETERSQLGCDRTSGVAAPPLSLITPIFGEPTPLGFLTWPMVVFCEVEMVWLEFGLVLHSFGP